MSQGGHFGYEDLEVWRRAVAWASAIVGLVEDLQTERRHYRLIEQLEASSTSVAMNTCPVK